MEQLNLQDFKSAFEKVRNDCLRETGKDPTSFRMNPTTHKVLDNLLGDIINKGFGFFKKIRWQDIPVNTNKYIELTAITAQVGVEYEHLVFLDAIRLTESILGLPEVDTSDVKEFVKQADNSFLMSLIDTINKEMDNRTIRLNG